jgi:hypothetical protein
MGKPAPPIGKCLAYRGLNQIPLVLFPEGANCS